MNSALTHTNNTIYQALGMCQLLCLKLCINHLLFSSHHPIFIPILQSGKQVFREISYHNEPRLGLSSFLHFFIFSNDFRSCFASNTSALLPNSMGQAIICTLVKEARSNDMTYAKKKKYLFIKCTEMTSLGGGGCNSPCRVGISIFQFTE